MGRLKNKNKQTKKKNKTKQNKTKQNTGRSWKTSDPTLMETTLQIKRLEGACGVMVTIIGNGEPCSRFGLV